VAVCFLDRANWRDDGNTTVLFEKIIRTVSSMLKTIATKDDLAEMTSELTGLKKDIRNYKKTIIWGMFISSVTQIAALWTILELFVKK
jgi:hypothetical protein